MIIRAIRKRRTKKVDGVINEIGRFIKQNQWPQELNKPKANNIQDTSATGATGAKGTEITASNDANLKTGETQ